MNKPIKLLFDDLYLIKDKVYKNNKLYYKLKKDFLTERFSLLTLSARNFNLEFIKKIINIFSLQNIIDFVFVVGSEDDKKILLDNIKILNGKVTINPDPFDVLYSSIKIGLKAISRRSDYIILQFCSLHNIKKETVKILIDRAKDSNKEILIPTYNRRKGHPIIFKSKMIPLFNSLRKEKGLPYLLKKYKDCIEEVEVLDENILR